MEKEPTRIEEENEKIAAKEKRLLKNLTDEELLRVLDGVMDFLVRQRDIPKDEDRVLHSALEDVKKRYERTKSEAIERGLIKESEFKGPEERKKEIEEKQKNFGKRNK